MQPRALLQRWWTYFALTAAMAGMYFALAVRGFSLGLYGDVLAYIYHYETRGIRGGMNWLVMEHWHRHLAGALASAPIQVLFPGDEAAWYAIGLAIHFGNAVLLFAFMDYWMRGKHRLLTVLAAVFFALDTLQTEFNLILATSTHRKISATMMILFLWLYLAHARSGHNRTAFYGLSLVLFSIGNAIYEQGFLLFLLFPLLALYENWQKPVMQPWWRYLMRIALEMFPFGMFVLSYVYLIDVLFISSNVESSVQHVINQVAGAINIAYNPWEIIVRSWPAVRTWGWTLLAIIGTVVAGGLLWQWVRRTETDTPYPWRLLLLGAGIMLLNAFSVAPTDFSIPFATRLVYVGGLGSGVVILCAMECIRRTVPGITGKALFTVVPALIIGSGVSQYFSAQNIYLERNIEREAVLSAVQDALPSWSTDEQPYLLIIPDAHPYDELALHAQDVGFPYAFDLLYDTEGILADVVYFDIGGPAETSGQHIIATGNGIVSPLRKEELIAPERLVVFAYDSTTRTAQIVEAVPPEILEIGNLYAEAPFTWETGAAYLPD
ncbi:MAG: hypothetical protein AAFR56_09835 [Chloroflexota bacterium]